MVSQIKTTGLTIRQQAEQEVANELATKAKDLIKGKLRELEKAKAVVNAIELAITDLEAQIADGTL
jgi:hypothetical protein